MHFVPVRNARDVPAAVAYLLAHPAHAEAIGAAGRAFVRRFLTRDGLSCYWLYFATLYSRYLALPVARDPVALPMLTHDEVDRVYNGDWVWREREAATGDPSE